MNNWQRKFIDRAMENYPYKRGCIDETYDPADYRTIISLLTLYPELNYDPFESVLPHHETMSNIVGNAEYHRFPRATRETVSVLPYLMPRIDGINGTRSTNRIIPKTRTQGEFEVTPSLSQYHQFPNSRYMTYLAPNQYLKDAYSLRPNKVYAWPYRTPQVDYIKTRGYQVRTKSAPKDTLQSIYHLVESIDNKYKNDVQAYVNNIKFVYSSADNIDSNQQNEDDSSITFEDLNMRFLSIGKSYEKTIENLENSLKQRHPLNQSAPQQEVHDSNNRVNFMNKQNINLANGSLGNAINSSARQLFQSNNDSNLENREHTFTQRYSSNQSGTKQVIQEADKMYKQSPSHPNSSLNNAINTDAQHIFGINNINPNIHETSPKSFSSKFNNINSDVPELRAIYKEPEFRTSDSAIQKTETENKDANSTNIRSAHTSGVRKTKKRAPLPTPNLTSSVEQTSRPTTTVVSMYALEPVDDGESYEYHDTTSDEENDFPDSSNEGDTPQTPPSNKPRLVYFNSSTTDNNRFKIGAPFRVETQPADNDRQKHDKTKSMNSRLSKKFSSFKGKISGAFKRGSRA